MGSEEDPGAAYLEMESQGVDVTGGSAGDGTAGAGMPESTDLLPLKYKNRDSTDLTADVAKDGGTFDFALTD